MEIKDLLRIKGTTKDGRIFDDQDKDHCPACGHPVHITLDSNLSDEQIWKLEHLEDAEVTEGMIKLKCPQCGWDANLKIRRVTIHKKA